MQQKKRPKHLTHSELFFVCYVFIISHYLSFVNRSYTKVISALGELAKALASIFFTLSEMNISFIFLQLSKISPLILLAESHSTFSRLYL